MWTLYMEAPKRKSRWSLVSITGLVVDPNILPKLCIHYSAGHISLKEVVINFRPQAKGGWLQDSPNFWDKDWFFLSTLDIGKGKDLNLMIIYGCHTWWITIRLPLSCLLQFQAFWPLLLLFFKPITLTWKTKCYVQLSSSMCQVFEPGAASILCFYNSLGATVASVKAFGTSWRCGRRNRLGLT